MKLKLDENISTRLKPVLSALGHDVETASDESLLGKPDSAVAASARAEGRVLLTLDVAFADLRRHPPGAHPGIVLFRPASLGERSVNQFVVDFANRADWARVGGCIVVVEPARIRVRRSEP